MIKNVKGGGHAWDKFWCLRFWGHSSLADRIVNINDKAVNGFTQKLKCIFIKSEFSVLFNTVYYLEKFIEITDNFGGKVVCGSLDTIRYFKV